MQYLEVSGALRPMFGSLGVKPLNDRDCTYFEHRLCQMWGLTAPFLNVVVKNPNISCKLGPIFELFQFK